VKKCVWVLSLFLLLLLSMYGSELIYSFWIKQDYHLETKYFFDKEYQKLEQENKKLLDVLDLWDEEEDIIVSKVILRDPLTFFDSISILKGKEEGIQLGDIVFNEFGYIGKVVDVTLHSSRVELLTNIKTEIPVEIGSSFGVFFREGKDFFVKNIVSKEKINQGDKVITSSFSSIPKNLEIALVDEVIETPVEQILKVSPIVDFQNLNYVFLTKEVNYE